MKCPACHHDNPLGLKFCGECGAKLQIACPSCGAVKEPAQKFCGHCGYKLGVEPAAMVSPASYTPKHLAEKILVSRSALEGERKQVTVLFCDIANSTPMADRVGAEAMHGLLHRFFGIAMEEVHRYEGTVNQFLGDGFMALFGAPVAHEDHARRAVLAATGLRKVLATAQTRLELPQGVTLAIRMGMHTGPVVVGSIGDNLRMDYTAIGDTTNLAARLQQCAGQDEIFVSEATARLIEGLATLEAMQPLTLKGQPHPVLAFRLTSAQSHRSRLEQGRALSPFVGRSRELDVLREALQESLAGRGQIVGVLGEAGSGKSRLLYELRRLLSEMDLTFLEGWCQSFGQSIPYLPIQDLLRAALRVSEGDEEHGLTSKLKSALDLAGMTTETIAPYLLRMLGNKEATQQLSDIGAETIQARTREFMVQYLLALSGMRPLVVLVEDLHWMDRTSEECLAAFAETLAGSRVLFLTSTRPGYSAPWSGKTYATQISLRSLGAQDARSIIAATVERVSKGTDVTDAILKKAEGNPFFLEELALALAHSHAGAQALPDTVQGVIAARIDRLSEGAKAVLQTGAVLGREFPTSLLAAICDVQDLPRALSALKQQEFLFERTTAEGPSYTFKHVLTQEVAYDSLLSVRQEALHDAAGRALEAQYRDDIERHCEVIAHHFSRANRPEKAVAYLEMACGKAIGANAVGDAQKYFELALVHYDKLPATRDWAVKQVSFLLMQLPTFMLQMKMPHYEQLLRGFEDKTKQTADDALLGRLYACLAHCVWFGGRLRESLTHCQAAVSLCEGVQDFGGVVHARMMELWNHVHGGNYPAAVRDQPLVHTALERAPHHRFWVWTKTPASYALAFMGQYPQAIGEAMEVVALGEKLSDSSLLSFAAFTVSIARTCEYETALGIEWAMRSLEAAPTPGDRAWAQLFLGWAKARHTPGEGIAELEPLVPVFRAVQFPAVEMLTLVALGEAYFLAGRLEDAHKILNEALDLSTRTEAHVWLEMAHRLMGETLFAKGKPEDHAVIESHLQAALSLCEVRQAEGEMAASYAVLARLRKSQCQYGEARQHFERSLALFEKLGTRVQPDKVRAELAALAS